MKPVLHIKKTGFSLLLIGMMLVASCAPDPEFQLTPELSFKIPEGWPPPVYDFTDNPLTPDSYELGHKFFFDPRLSVDNSTSCGSCHQPFSAFAQLDHAVSHGIKNLEGTRNSPPLFNLAWHDKFFWDGGVNHLESQPINPIENPVEMGIPIEDLIKKLNAIEEYHPLVKKVYGDGEITSQRLFKSLAIFMSVLISADSKYDRRMRGEENFTEEEEKGLAIFQSKCSQCHTPPLFTDLSFRNNGLKPNAVNDSGRAHITMDPADIGKFKVPSLRNLTFSPPYMHDGRLKTIDEILDHYDSGIHVSPTLDTLLTNGIQLSPQERIALKSFLKTLDDKNFVSNPLFAEKQ